MARNRILKGALLGTCCAALMAGSASAAVISSITPVDFSGGSISFGYNGSHDFTFTDVSGGIFFHDPAVAVSTINGGAVTVLGAPFYNPPKPTVYQDPKGGFFAQAFGPNTFTNYAPFSQPTGIQYSITTFIIGLQDTTADGVHYGYGEFAGTQLLSYGFETTPDAIILAGALGVSAVPLPSSAPMFGAALLALGAAGYSVKRKKAAVTA